MAKYTVCNHCRKMISMNDKHDCPNKPKRKTYDNETNKAMRTSRWKKKRLYIIKLYDGCCQRCLIKYGIINEADLTVHHIYSRKHYPELMWEDDNLICVCMTCNNQLKAVKDGTLDFPIELKEREYNL